MPKIFVYLEAQVFFHHFGTMTHIPGIENPQYWEILGFLAILSNHKIHHIYLNLAVLLTYYHHCMLYYMRLCKVEYSTFCKNSFRPTFFLT